MSEKTATADPIAVALSLARVGWAVFPCRDDGTPRVAWGSAATTDTEQVKAWWAEHPADRVGVHAGRSGIVVVDRDRHEGKPDGFAGLKAAGHKLPPTMHYKSRSGKGRHDIYAAPHGVDLTIAAGHPVPGVDIRSGVGMIVYSGPALTERPKLAPAPEWSLVRRRAQNTEHADADAVKAWLAASKGKPSDATREHVRSVPTEGAGNHDLVGILGPIVRSCRDRKGREWAIDNARERWTRHHADTAPAFDRALAKVVADERGEALTTTLKLGKKKSKKKKGRRAESVDPEVEEAAHRIEVTEAARRLVAERKAGTITLPDIVTLPTMLSQPDEATRWRVGGLLATGARVVVAAQYKAGKSTAIGNLIRALADGSDFLGRFDTEQAGRIVLIDNELDPRELRRWMRAYGIQHPERVEIVSLRGKVSTFDVIDSSTRERWAQHIGPADVVIFDCLRPVLDALGLDENRDAGRFLVAFDELLAEVGASEAVLVHHMGHNGERSRGDSRILDWPDATWRIVRSDPADPTSDRYFSAFGRDVDVREGVIEFDPDTRALAYTEGTIAQGKLYRDMLTAAPLIVEYVRENPGCSGADIERDVPGGDSMKRQTRAQLVREGVLIEAPRQGKGGGKAYSVADALPEFANPGNPGKPRLDGVLTSATPVYKTGLRLDEEEAEPRQRRKAAP